LNVAATKAFAFKTAGWFAPIIVIRVLQGLELGGEYDILGGSVSLIGLSICAATGNINDAGLYYPIAVAAVTFIVGSLTLHETHGTRIWYEGKALPAAS
jgi:hypothetical protein